MKIKRLNVKRLDIEEIKSNHPILARTKLFFMLPKLIFVSKCIPAIKTEEGNIQVISSSAIYTIFIPRFKISKLED